MLLKTRNFLMHLFKLAAIKLSIISYYICYDSDNTHRPQYLNGSDDQNKIEKILYSVIITSIIFSASCLDNACLTKHLVTSVFQP